MNMKFLAFVITSPYIYNTALAISLTTGGVSQQFHIVFDTYFTTINFNYRNIVPPSYCKSMCGFVKGKKSVFVHYKQHDLSTTLISTSYQGRASTENATES